MTTGLEDLYEIAKYDVIDESRWDFREESINANNDVQQDFKEDLTVHPMWKVYIRPEYQHIDNWQWRKTRGWVHYDKWQERNLDATGSEKLVRHLLTSGLEARRRMFIEEPTSTANISPTPFSKKLENFYYNIQESATTAIWQYLPQNRSRLIVELDTKEKFIQNKIPLAMEVRGRWQFYAEKENISIETGEWWGPDSDGYEKRQKEKL